MTYVGESSLGHSVFSDEGSGPLRLSGSRCPACGDIRLPPRTLCGNDLTACEPFELSGDGTIYETVQVSLAPQGFEAPFWVGYVDLDEGARYFAQIGWTEGDPDPGHGDRVTMSIEAIGTGNEPVLGPVFRRVARDAGE